MQSKDYKEYKECDASKTTTSKTTTTTKQR